MAIDKVLSFSTINNQEKGVDYTHHLTGDERISLLEDLRQEMAKVTGHEYPQRLRRVLEITHR